jgi:hypothetical protein
MEGGGIVYKGDMLLGPPRTQKPSATATLRWAVCSPAFAAMGKDSA